MSSIGRGWMRACCFQHALFALSTIIIVSGAQLDAGAVHRTIKNLTHHETRSNDHVDTTSAMGASRSEGGEQVRPFPWIVTLWRTPRRVFYSPTGGTREEDKNLLNGLAIRLTTLNVLANIESVLRTANDESYYQTSEEKEYGGATPSHIEYDPEQTINVTRGIEQLAIKGFTWQHIVTLNENVALWHLTPRYGTFADDPYFAELPGIPKDQLPVMESNKSAPDTNCYAYSYSFPVGQPGPVRTFSKWPVRIITCRRTKHDRCLMKLNWASDDVWQNETHRGNVCDSLSDSIGPVMCGGDGKGNIGKLSYVIVPENVNELSEEYATCRDSFYVLRLADYYGVITGSYNKINEPSTWPNWW